MTTNYNLMSFKYDLLSARLMNFQCLVILDHSWDIIGSKPRTSGTNPFIKLTYNFFVWEVTFEHGEGRCDFDIAMTSYKPSLEEPNISFEFVPIPRP